MYYLMMQFFYIAPSAYLLQIAVFMEAVTPERRVTVAQIAFLIMISSLITCIYGTFCLIGVAEACESIEKQVLEHRQEQEQQE